eukprot:2013040-Pyramimonas_sp.AAC.1
MLVSCLLSCPSCPKLPRPHVYTSPSCVTAALCQVPAATPASCRRPAPEGPIPSGEEAYTGSAGQSGGVVRDQARADSSTQSCCRPAPEGARGNPLFIEGPFRSWIRALSVTTMSRPPARGPLVADSFRGWIVLL